MAHALSVGLGLTNDCNLSCAHCYRSTDSIAYLSLQDVQTVCEHLSVSSVGLGTGENALHPQFLDILSYLHERRIKLSMASNGYSLTVIPSEYLMFFRDVEISIDFPTERGQDAFRGAGSWGTVCAALNRCQELGIEVSILSTMMNTNYDQMDDLARLARSWGVNLRFNVYQPVQNGRFNLSYEQFWDGFRRVLAVSKLLSCTEPVVRAALGLTPVHSPCGFESIRVTPDRHVAPCVYWPSATLTIDDLGDLGAHVLETGDFQQVRQVPPIAADCLCQGGCASRRALLGALNQHDLYCPWVRGETVHLDYGWASHKDLVRARNYCTTIVA